MKVLILTDIHANFQALTAVLDRFSDVDEVWCLGDIVEIGPCPGECIDRIKASCEHVIKGNHDASFVDFDPSKAHPEWNGWEHHRVTPGQLDYLRHLPTELTVPCGNFSYLLVHGSPENPLSGRLQPDTEPDVLHEAVAQCRDGILCGHTHMAMILNIGGKWVVNAGTVGQPRDGDYRAQCMILQDGVFTHHLVKYDLDAMERDYQRSSLPTFVKEEWIRHTRLGMVERHGLQTGPLSRR